MQGLLWPFVFMIGTGLVLLWGWVFDIVIEGWRERRQALADTERESAERSDGV